MNPSSTIVRSLRVTIDQIAAEARVGRTTVADIVNRGAGHRYRPTTRNRVLRTAKRLGYVPSGIAQAIARGSSGQVGLMLTCDFNNPYWARLAGEVEARLRQRGLFMQLAITDGDPNRELALVRHLHGLHIEGLIVGPVYSQRALEEHREILRGSIPIVAFGSNIQGFDVVSVDHAAARRLAVEHLAELGHRRIGYLCLPDEAGPLGEGLNITAFRDSVVHKGVFDPQWVLCQPESRVLDQYRRVIQTFVQRWRQTEVTRRPTAMVCHNDRVAMTAMSVFHQHGIRVPQDLSLVGLDNLPEAQITAPPLTTLDTHTDDQMHHAMRLLLDEPRNGGTPPRVVVVTPTLVVRDTTTRPPITTA